MPYQVQHMILGKSAPVCVYKEDSVSQALSIMIEHDYSQLPVVHEQDNFPIPDGLITYEGIIRGIRNFKAKIEDLRVRDVMISVPIYSVEDDLFDILDRLKDTNAVLIRAQDENYLEAIVTSYDASEYFRKRTEDLMRVEDIEVIVKDFIKAAYSQNGGELDGDKLQDAINRVTANTNKNDSSGKVKTFGDLALAEYISILLMKETWSFLEPFFGIPKELVRELLNGIRGTRNDLAHFRGEITPEARDRLKFGTEWMAKCQEQYQEFIHAQERQKIQELLKDHKQVTVEVSEEPPTVFGVGESTGTETSTGGGRYAPLADWLQNQPGRIDEIPLTFNQIEEIIGTDLPASARNHRAWWANDAVGHTHSQLWLDAGWKSSYVNLSEGRVLFIRIRERERAYIDFYSSLLDELRRIGDFPLRDVSPDGASWMEVQPITWKGRAYAYLNYSFSRDRRFRVELYLDLADQAMTKAVFEQLQAQKETFEAQLGTLSWERLDNRRASRIVRYREGSITETEILPELRKWAAATMVKFYQVLREPAEQAIAKVMQS